MAKPNYSYQKRQKEIAKQQKKEEKRQRKLSRTDQPLGEGEVGEPDDATVEGAADEGTESAEDAATE